SDLDCSPFLIWPADSDKSRDDLSDLIFVLELYLNDIYSRKIVQAFDMHVRDSI
ncbi:17993_t:CDS:1, partial [Funneliformis geosporum]